MDTNYGIDGVDYDSLASKALSEWDAQQKADQVGRYKGP